MVNFWLEANNFDYIKVFRAFNVLVGKVLRGFFHTLKGGNDSSNHQTSSDQTSSANLNQFWFSQTETKSRFSS
jgi:hypothetical protein